MLSEVIKYLRDESIKGSGQEGINFLINPHDVLQGAVTIDPNTGLPVPTAPRGARYQWGDRQNGAMTDISLANLIDAIIKSSDQQIKYSIED